MDTLSKIKQKEYSYAIVKHLPTDSKYSRLMIVQGDEILDTDGTLRNPETLKAIDRALEAIENKRKVYYTSWW